MAENPGSVVIRKREKRTTFRDRSCDCGQCRTEKQSYVAHLGKLVQNYELLEVLLSCRRITNESCINWVKGLLDHGVASCKRRSTLSAYRENRFEDQLAENKILLILVH
mmetsp:Transcript_13816/g.32240  ORF Transcript_13816/g.32240 Transcript_13816/m.32240 type:complete len:109 (-) Transcript_13816:47-373(-)